MHLKVAESSGFCFGVDHAVKAAYACLQNPKRKLPTYMLGEITHNEYVVADRSLPKSVPEWNRIRLLRPLWIPSEPSCSVRP